MLNYKTIPEVLFTCLPCQAHFDVEHLPQPVTECPVCGWRKKPASEQLANLKQAFKENDIPGPWDAQAKYECLLKIEQNQKRHKL